MEILRIISIFLIVLHHSMFFGLGMEMKADLFIWAGGVGVDCFVLISGYYMVHRHISIAKILKLWVQVLMYSVALCSVYLFTLPGNEGNIFPELLSAFLPVCTNQYWFITAYMILMLATPFLNKLLYQLSPRGLLMCSSGLFIIMSVLNYLYPPLSNLGTIVLFVLLYSIAAGIRLNHLRVMSRRECLIWMLSSLAAIWVCVLLKWQATDYIADGIAEAVWKFGGEKKSWLALALSLSLFMLFASIRVRSNRWINYLAACSLGVYLLHTNKHFLEYPWKGFLHLNDAASSPWWLAHCLGASVLIYAICLCAEILRLNTLGRLYDYIAPRWILPAISSAWEGARKLLAL